MGSRLLPFGLGAVLLGAIPAVPHGPLWNGTVPADSPVVATAALTAAGTPGVALASAGMTRASLSMLDSAREVLASRVGRQSDPAALRMAFTAYYAYRAAHPEQVRNPYLYYVDYGLDSRTPRGYVFNMDDLTVVDGPFTVAHGRGSSSSRDGVPTRFSNYSGSATSSLGLYLTLGSYSFTGHTGGRAYSAMGLRLEGVSGSFNSAALARGVVMHGAPYVTPTGAGRSQGCPAVELERARKLIPMIANGGLVFLFSPADAQWLHGDPWANAQLAEQLTGAMHDAPAAPPAAAQATSPAPIGPASAQGH